jgi:glycosyltransferase involved in cell wall biosynthesis
MLVSAIISNHNYGRFLPEAIDSALRQDGVDVEVVVVDDGSTDDSADIIRDYEAAFPNLRGVFQENLGQWAALNAGVLASRGGILAFLDADDIWLPGKLSAIAGWHRDHDLVLHNLVKETGEKYTLIDPALSQRRKLLSYGYALSGPTSALSVSRRIARGIFPLPETDLRLCADVYLSYRGLQLAEMFTSDEVLATYRVHGDNGWYGRRDLDMIRQIVGLLNDRALADGLPRIPLTDESFVRAMVHSVPLAPGGRYVLYGAGSAGTAFRTYVDTVGARCVGVVDSDPARWGHLHVDQVVEAPDALPVHVAAGARIVIASMHTPAILARLESMGYHEGAEVLVPRL